MRAVIVQARLGSTRLPGKVLMDLGGVTVLGSVLNRCKAIKADVVCCAIPFEDDAIAEESERWGVSVWRGPEDDVLARYYGAAEALGATEIMRITADCPFIDPTVCNAVFELRAAQNADYASNVMPRGWPKGLDCEAFTFDALEQAHEQATFSYDREHVTAWLQRSPHIRRVNLEGPGKTGNLCIDTIEDLRRWAS